MTCSDAKRDSEVTLILLLFRQLVLNEDRALLTQGDGSEVFKILLICKKPFRYLEYLGMYAIASKKGIVIWSLLSISMNFPHSASKWSLCTLVGKERGGSYSDRQTLVVALAMPS
ncbi:unnamed protein product [Linum trigynum]|uniref:Uncharacterized protein n=1 Tax=Linum trigynum TaxID=586398 RepID=A0AAV2FS43_9ROSI